MVAVARLRFASLDLCEASYVRYSKCAYALWWLKQRSKGVISLSGRSQEIRMDMRELAESRKRRTLLEDRLDQRKTLLQGTLLTTQASVLASSICFLKSSAGKSRFTGLLGFKLETQSTFIAVYKVGPPGFPVQCRHSPSATHTAELATRIATIDHWTSFAAS